MTTSTHLDDGLSNYERNSRGNIPLFYLDSDRNGCTAAHVEAVSSNDNSYQ
jgi:hypothetical protein